MNKHKLLRLLPEDWNARVFTEADFFGLCEQDGVRVFTAELPAAGIYCVYRATPIIFLHRDLRGPQRLHVEFHELGHHWLHAPGVQFFLNTNNKVEFEANLVAACSLIPQTLLMNCSITEIAEEYGYSEELLSFRIQVFTQWGI